MKKFILISVLMLTIASFAGAQNKSIANIKDQIRPVPAGPKQDTAYVLVGRIPDFQLLYRAIVSPGDVTPNQAKALAEWLNKVQMILPDSINKKK